MTQSDRAMFVGQGRFLPGPRVEYRVYRVATAEREQSGLDDGYRSKP
jgi:hypothetical protein